MGFEIPLDIDYTDHPKALLMISLMGPCGDIYPIRLWCWCAKFARNGIIAGGLTQVEEACRWNGKAGKLHAAFIQAGILERDGKTVHDWMEHAGRKLAQYERKKKKQRAAYAEECGNSSGRIPADCGNSADLQAGILPTLNETKRNETKTNEKKEHQTAPTFDLTDKGLGLEFVFYSTSHVGMRKRDDPTGIAPMIGALVNLGISREAIQEEIRNRDRDTNEWFSSFAERLKKAHKAANGQTKDEFRAALKAEMKKGA